MPELAQAVDGLYHAFERYPLRPVIRGCPHCVGLDDQGDLHVTPLRELTDLALGKFAFKALTTWGDTDDLRHFLPRLLELTLNDGRDAIDLEPVLGKLELGGWHAWPEDEQQAITAFLAALWRRSGSAGPARYRIADLADMLGQAGFDLALFLALLDGDSREQSVRQVAALCRGAASRSAADRRASDRSASGRPDYRQQVREWLARPATRALLEVGFFAASSAEVAAELSEALLLADAIAAEN